MKPYLKNLKRKTARKTQQLKKSSNKSTWTLTAIHFTSSTSEIPEVK